MSSIPGWIDSTNRIPGCLPRASITGQVCSRFPAGWVIPKVDWPALLADPNRINMRPSIPVVLDQDGVGSCATESSTGSVMAINSFNGRPFTLLNPWFVYHTTSGGRDGGSNIDTNLVFIREHGIAPESVWPRSKGFRAKPSEEAVAAALDYRILEFYDITNDVEFGSSLLLGFPVVYGRSGHSILATDLLELDLFEYLNSWGNWGDAGFGKESLSRSVNYGYGALAIRATTSSGSMPTPNLVASIPRPEHLMFVPRKNPLVIEPFPLQPIGCSCRYS